MAYLIILHYVLMVISVKIFLRENNGIEWQEYYLRLTGLSRSQVQDLKWFITYFPAVNTFTALFLLVAFLGFLYKKLKN